MIKKFIERDIRYKTLSATFNSVTSTFFLSNASFGKYLSLLLIGFCIQSIANLYNSFQDGNRSELVKISLILLIGFTLVFGVLVSNFNLLLIFLGLFALVIAIVYSYESPILKVKSSETPLADLFVLLSFGPLATLGGGVFLSGIHLRELVALSVINAILSHNLLWIHRLKDLDKDANLGKKTLAVSLGKNKSLLLMALENLYAIFITIDEFGIITGGVLLGAAGSILSLLWFNNFFAAFHFWVIFLLLNPLILKFYGV